MRGGQCGSSSTFDLLDEDRRAIDTIDITGVVTTTKLSATVLASTGSQGFGLQEDTTKRGEGTHEVGLPCDRRLNAVDIISGLESDRVAPCTHLGVFDIFSVGHLCVCDQRKATTRGRSSTADGREVQMAIICILPLGLPQPSSQGSPWRWKNVTTCGLCEARQ
jgi:hypothetical protein